MSGQPQYPGWAYLLAGLAIGLFVAFLVYLHNLPEPGQRSSKTAETEKDGRSAPEFDFYKILPELEVVVPGLEVLKEKEDESSTPAPPEPTPELSRGEAFVVQVGSFNDHKQADRLKASLALLGLQAHIQDVTVDNTSWHRVRIGPYTDRRTLNSVRQRLKDNGIKAITLKVSGD